MSKAVIELKKLTENARRENLDIFRLVPNNKILYAYPKQNFTVG